MHSNVLIISFLLIVVLATPVYAQDDTPSIPDGFFLGGSVTFLTFEEPSLVSPTLNLTWLHRGRVGVDIGLMYVTSPHINFGVAVDIGLTLSQSVAPDVRLMQEVGLGGWFLVEQDFGSALLFFQANLAPVIRVDKRLGVRLDLLYHATTDFRHHLFGVGVGLVLLPSGKKRGS